MALEHGLFAVWDDLPDEKRDLLLAYDEMVCGRCGNLRSECSDPMIDWHPRVPVCYASGTTEWAKGLLEKHYQTEQPEDGELGTLAGRWVWVSPIAPPVDDDEFASLVAFAAQEARSESA